MIVYVILIRIFGAQLACWSRVGMSVHFRVYYVAPFGFLSSSASFLTIKQTYISEWNKNKRHTPFSLHFEWRRSFIGTRDGWLWEDTTTMSLWVQWHAWTAQGPLSINAYRSIIRLDCDEENWILARLNSLIAIVSFAHAVVSPLDSSLRMFLEWCIKMLRLHRLSLPMAKFRYLDLRIVLQCFLPCSVLLCKWNSWRGRSLHLFDCVEERILQSDRSSVGPSDARCTRQGMSSRQTRDQSGTFQDLLLYLELL